MLEAKVEQGNYERFYSDAQSILATSTLTYKSRQSHPPTKQLKYNSVLYHPFI